MNRWQTVKEFIHFSVNRSRCYYLFGDHYYYHFSALKRRKREVFSVMWKNWFLLRRTFKIDRCIAFVHFFLLLFSSFENMTHLNCCSYCEYKWISIIFNHFMRESLFFEILLSILEKKKISCWSSTIFPLCEYSKSTM